MRIDDDVVKVRISFCFQNFWRVLRYKGRFARSNFGPIIIYNVFVYDGKF